MNYPPFTDLQLRLGHPRFNLESFHLHHDVQPRRVVVEFRIIPTGAEQLEPFTASLMLGEPAARQLAEALTAALASDERG
jgi:hypothetical protein